MMDFLILLLGLAVLVVGGEFLVKSAVGFSNKLKISPLVIGMTVVAFGTSAPELIVSMESALIGKSGIAIGNVVGSNIANLALVLGLTVLIFPIITDRQTKRVDFPMMLFATLLFYYFAIDGIISFSDGIILFTILVVFLVFIITSSRKKTKKQEAVDIVSVHIPFWKSGVFLGIGLVGLYFGAGWFVDGAVGIADIFLEGNPDRDMIVGVTVVAFGTSAPELVASCVAAYRKQTDISVGNLIGSNIFNIFAVIGLTSIVKPIEVSKQALNFDMMWMIGIAVLLAFVLLIGKKIGRLKGVILLLTYITYITIILLKVQGLI
ncbi:MAG: calcium/sodium antiporter [Crocinitomicaceae bacterium]